MPTLRNLGRRRHERHKHSRRIVRSVQVMMDETTGDNSGASPLRGPSGLPSDADAVSFSVGDRIDRGESRYIVTGSDPDRGRMVLTHIGMGNASDHRVWTAWAGDELAPNGRAVYPSSEEIAALELVTAWAERATPGSDAARKVRSFIARANGTI